jgi:hypothetical protein
MKKLMLMTFSLMFVLLANMNVFSQTLGEDYDRRERAVDPFEDEDRLLREKKINEIINRIKRGDRTVLRLVVFDTLEAVHDELVRKAGTQRNYYEMVGGRSSLPAFIGGFDNQDPKVRLKCIGYLGDWIDEVGKDSGLIEKAVDKRLATNIETRKEVRYGYRVLKMKIVRRRIISALRKGDNKILVRVSPEEFLPVVFYEPRIRTIYLGAPGTVRIRSIVLDPGVEPETGALVTSRPGRWEGLDIERICYKETKTVNDRGEVAQWLEDIRKQGSLAIQQAALTGGTTGGNTDTAPAAGKMLPNKATVDMNCVKAIYCGLDNKSLFVREHAARIFLNYVRGWTGDKNYVGAPNTATRAYSADLGKMARNPYYVRLAQVTWDNVKWSEYYYNDKVTSPHNYLSFVQHKHYLEYEYAVDHNNNNAAVNYNEAATKRGEARGSYVPARTTRYFTADAVKYPEWGTELTGNYRNDVKEILRILGLSWYIDAEYVIEAIETQVQSNRIDTLFNDKERANRPRRPDRSDRLEGESATSYVGPQPE